MKLVLCDDGGGANNDDKGDHSVSDISISDLSSVIYYLHPSMPLFL